ncbi:MAG: permease prefix domain 1-containing protein [Syntrophaceticus sp.]|nr:permease prefix domain 1-containing protein [Syntrophaceticus sp.]MDD4359410.1 permease prefix domain 1-containing protein [Syntrophaceticus sp.]MDD4783664.1 permease prefix domain 1-containing protein [Syntrophaceticus sp.]
MSKSKNRIEKKVTDYIDNLFAGVGASQQLFDLKEELATNMKEKIADYRVQGMEEEQAFKETVISMGDLSGLVDDMRKVGQDTAKQEVYSTMTARISTAGIVVGVLLVLFGMFTMAMQYYMDLPKVAVAGTGVFIVAGGALLTYSVLTRETRIRYGMNKIRAAFYALSVGLLLFGLCTAAITRYATGEIYVSIAALMVFSLVGIGVLLFLILTESDRRKS